MIAPQSIAVWAITPDGSAIAAAIAKKFSNAAIYTGSAVLTPPAGAKTFESLAQAVAGAFKHYDAHVFIMAAGIVVRLIAPHISTKQADPAVVVVDDAGHFAISLLSGHSKGANSLAGLVAQFIGATPVITTATDNAGVPAIDLLAEANGLVIENPETIKIISMAFLTGRHVWRHDPWGILERSLEGDAANGRMAAKTPGIFIDHVIRDLPENVLIARPPTLAVGMGCNRKTSADELICTVQAVFDQEGLSTASIRHFATIVEKMVEPGMIEMAAYFGRPLIGFTKEELQGVENVPTPSDMVHKHMGVASVCEAAAMLSMKTNTLLITKQKTKNTTLAVAVGPYLS
jgi:cobalt-precorrin 5A hydrolase